MLETTNPLSIPVDARWATISRFKIETVSYNKEIRYQTYKYSIDGSQVVTSSEIPPSYALWVTLAHFNNGWASPTHDTSNEQFATYVTNNPVTSPPTGSITINSGAAYTSSSTVTLEVNASDPENDPLNMRFSNDNATWSNWETVSTTKVWPLAAGDGSKTVYMQIQDAGGLVSDTYSDTIILDTVPPTGAVKINNDSSYTSSTSVTLNVTGTDASGVTQMQFSNDNTTWSSWEAFSASKSWTLVAGEGNKTVYMNLRDGAGNVSSFSDTIIVDTTPPDTFITSGPAGITSSTGAIFTFTSNEGSSSFECRLDGGAYTACTSPAILSGLGTGSHTFSVRAKDAAGNVDSTPATYTWTIDTVPPVVTGVSNGQTVNTDLTVTFNEGTATLNGSPFTNGTKISNEGLYTLVVTDAAGNTTTISFTIDKTPPTGSFTINNGAAFTSSESVTLDITESGSTDMRFSNDGSTWTNWETVKSTKGWTLTAGDGSKTVHMQLRDDAGNETSLTNSITLVSPPGAPQVTADDLNNVITGLTTAMEFSVDGGAYVQYTGSNHPDLSGDRTVRVRVAANAVTGAPTGADTIITFTTNPPPTVTQLTLTPSTATVEVGATQQYRAIAEFTDGATTDVTSLSTWSVDKPAIAGVTNGLVNVTSADTVTVTAEYQGNLGTATLIGVETPPPAPTVTSIGVTPDTITLLPGATHQLYVEATMSNGSTKDVTAGSEGTTYLSANTNLVTVSPNGLITVASGAQPGTIEVTIINNGHTKTVAVVITQPSQPLSSNANLRNLTVNQGTINPIFDPGVTEYTLTLPNQSTSIDLLATLDDTNASMTINGQTQNNGVIKSIHVPEGNSVVAVVVTAQDGTKKTYKLTLYRAYASNGGGSSGGGGSSSSTVQLPPVEVKQPEPPKVPPSPIVFNDIEKHWAKEKIQEAVQKGLVSGYPDGSFRPNQPVTRIQWVSLLARALQLQGEEEVTSFHDQEEIPKWAEQSLSLVVKKGLVNGYPDGTFRPNQEITRAEMASVLARALKLEVKNRPSTTFSDNEKIPEWARGFVSALLEKGLIHGRDDNQFVPNDSTTRAEAVVLLLNMLEQK
ncbi:S-layer homology domain-containing protein [Aneurinibacillus uraniidurans]|uniref:S-layer homology domain-containing protein n=1 Tax=Aneurinibacillus uraniidurans TaxID=2966586 RepID=UPI00234BB197|nr:S-layer homology domain-containing protein [Aneurinibacillus sp. B1]WCN36581.1 S-layer homology domain-containing protein [Aneurinibacillus sp. B1]